MAMTDYQNVLLHTGYCDGDTSQPVKLHMAYKISQSITDNRTTLLLGMYVVNPTPIGPWTDYYGSYLGQHKFDGSIPNYRSGRWLVENVRMDVSHANDGTATASIPWKWGVNSPWARVEQPSGTVQLKLPTIPRASTVSAGNGTLGVSQTLTVAKKAEGYTHTIKYTCGSASGTICTKSSAASISWTPPLDLAAQNTTGGTVTIKLTATTYNGGTQIGEPASTTMTAAIPDSVKPSVSLSLSEQTDYHSKYGAYVQGKTQVKVTIKATMAYGATLRSSQIEVGGVSYPGSSATVSPAGSGSVQITGYATDSRLRTGSGSTPVDVLAYTAPQITTITTERCNSKGVIQSRGDHAKVTFSARITPLGKKNTAEYEVQYRIQGSGSWTTMYCTAAKGDYAPVDASCVFPADSSKAYEIRVGATDDFGTVYSGIFGLSVGFELMEATSDGTGLAIGQEAVKSNTLEVALPAEFHGALSFGALKAMKYIRAHEDLNDYIELGLMAVPGHEDAKTVKNLPLPYAGLILNISGVGSDAVSGAWIPNWQYYWPLREGEPARRRLIETNAEGVRTFHGWETVGGSGSGGSGGLGIVSLVQTVETSESGGKNVWKATFTDDSTAFFNVYNGQQGQKGLDGKSPKIEASRVSDGVNLKITNADGTTDTVKLKDGEPGPSGGGGGGGAAVITKSTTLQEVKNLYKTTPDIILKADDNIYTLARALPDNNIFSFHSARTTEYGGKPASVVDSYALKSSGWSPKNSIMMMADNNIKDASPTATNKESRYPNTYAVKQYVDEMIGSVDTLIGGGF